MRMRIKYFHFHFLEIPHQIMLDLLHYFWCTLIIQKGDANALGGVQCLLEKDLFKDIKIDQLICNEISTFILILQLKKIVGFLMKL